MSCVSRHVPLVLCSFVVCAFGVTAGAAASPQRVGTAESLCTVAKGVARSLKKPPATASLATAQGQALFKRNLGKIVAAKAALIGASPSRLRPDMRRAIGLFVLFKTDLTKVKYNFAALETKPAMLHGLESAITKTEPSFHRLNRYFTKTCHY